MLTLRLPQHIPNPTRRALRPRPPKTLPRIHPIDLIRIPIILLLDRPHTPPRPITPSRRHLLQLPTITRLIRRAHRLEASLGLLLVFERVVDDFLLGGGLSAGERGVGVGGGAAVLGLGAGGGLEADLLHEGFGLGGVFALFADGGAVFVEEEGEGETGEGEEGGDGRGPVDAEGSVHLGGELEVC